MKPWIAVALLAGSWMLGLGYYAPDNLAAWVGTVAIGALLLAERPAGALARLVAGWDTRGWSSRPREAGLLIVAIVLLLAAVALLPWPYAVAPLLPALGGVLVLAPIPRSPARSLGWGAIRAGVVLVLQAFALLAYTGHAARSHDLPRPVVSLAGAVIRALGVNAAVDGPAIAIRSMRRVHRLPVSWELLLDPVTVGFVAGGFVVVGLAVWNMTSNAERKTVWIRPVVALILIVVGWLPIRLALMVGLMLHRAIVTDLTIPLTVMNQFFSPWLMLLLVLPLVLLACRFVVLPIGEAAEASPEPASATASFRPGILAAAVLVAFGITTFVLTWDPAGHEKSGRVMVVERHSTWEPTVRPYDTTFYGEAGSYNYAAIYDYCSRFFEMSRFVEAGQDETRPRPAKRTPVVPRLVEPNKLVVSQADDPNAIDDDILRGCDVLVVKTPTERYQPSEIWAIERFVRRGGGLLLIGDHTNVFGTSSFLNEIARPFGFKFRHDLLFRIGKAYDQEVLPAAVPHPAVQYLPPMTYAVSCSIDPGRSFGRAAVESTGLWSLPPDYHADNFHPQAEYLPEMYFGPFIQLWATRYGSGRVMAFTDSTIFSSFSTFQPGKAELMLGMLDWLNRTSRLDRASVRWPVIVTLLLLAASLLAAGVWLAFGRVAKIVSEDSTTMQAKPVGQLAGLLLLAVALLGIGLGMKATTIAQQSAMPEPKPVRPMTRLVIDRGLSKVPLSLGAFPEGDGDGYGLMEQWLSRLGCFTARRAGLDVFTGDALVVICPSESVSEAYRRKLVDYVASGGRLLVIDSLENKGTTANSLLWPFGMAIEHATIPQGKLSLLTGWPDIEMAGSCRIVGGEPFMWVGDTPVAASVSHGKGTVMAVGFGLLFDDDRMGGHWMNEPDAAIALRYDTLFAIVRGLLSGEPVAPPKSEQSAVAQVAGESPAKQQ